MNKFLAKTNPIETIQEHTDKLLYHYDQMMLKYIDLLSEKQWFMIKEAIIHHDLGKLNIKFQNKLYDVLQKNVQLNDKFPAKEEIYHNYLSVAFLDRNKYSREESIIIGLSVFFHHERNIKDEYNKEYLSWIIKQMNEDTNNFKYKGLNFVANAKNLKYVNNDIRRQNGVIKYWDQYIIIKGFLNKFDYAASSGINVIEESNLDDNKENITDKILKKFKNLRKVQNFMYNNQDSNLIITAPTGMGKTEASLLWIGDSKGFFTLPLKVSINAIYERIKSKKDLNYDKVGLLHSGALEYYFKELDGKNENFDDALIKYNETKLLSKPLTITTVDQIFKFIFKYNGCESILVTMKYSKVVIDEIQMYSSELVAYLLLGIKMLDDLNSRFAIVTATLPPIFIDFMKKLGIDFNKIKIKDFTDSSENYLRHNYCIKEKNEFDYKFIENESRIKKILIITNTVKRAQNVFERLEIENKRLLHSNFIKKDRDYLEKEIIEFTNEEKNENKVGVWVTTQIVEASLDIDFDLLITDMTSIDSLFQRFGRVYRKRKYTLDQPNIYVYNNNSGRGTIVDKDIYDFSLAVLRNYENRNLTENVKKVMIDNVFDSSINLQLKYSKYYKKIDDNINQLMDLKPYTFYNKKDIKNQFRNIDSIKIIPSKIWRELLDNKIIDRWKKVLNSKDYSKNEKFKVKIEIEKYTMNLSYYHHLPIEFHSELIYPYSRIYLCNCDYDEVKGLIKISRKEYESNVDYNFI